MSLVKYFQEPFQSGSPLNFIQGVSVTNVPFTRCFALCLAVKFFQDFQIADFEKEKGKIQSP